jgi:GNAT superfamily N-acetyltransferase
MLSVRQMTSSDIAGGMRLSAQAGWNQTEADWRRFLDLEPEGCFVGEVDGKLVATTTTRVFGPIGWIGMVLVDQAMRRRGIGTAMMEHALAYLTARGVATMRLDATPLGQPIYQRLGFVAEYALARWEGVSPGTGCDARVRAVAASQIAGLADLDRCATGTDRQTLLRYLWEHGPQTVLTLEKAGQLAGYAAFRSGARAVQLGPIVARSDDAGRALADAALARLAGQNIFVDIPENHVSATRWAQQRKLHVQRKLVRMFRGQPVHETHPWLWASSGPENG